MAFDVAHEIAAAWDVHGVGIGLLHLVIILGKFSSGPNIANRITGAAKRECADGDREQDAKEGAHGCGEGDGDGIGLGIGLGIGEGIGSLDDLGR